MRPPAYIRCLSSGTCRRPLPGWARTTSAANTPAPRSSSPACGCVDGWKFHRMARMFINGQFVDATGGALSEIRNPASGALVDTVPLRTGADARAAIDAAYAARDAWRAVDPSRRGALLGK